MEQLAVRPLRRRSRLTRRLLPFWLFVVLSLVVLIVTVTTSSSSGAVDRVTIVNPTDYTVSVEVAGARGGWTAIGYASRHATTALHAVADQGETWRFRFSSQGEDGGQIALARRVLVGAGWTARVPDVVEARLRATGAPPSV